MLDLLRQPWHWSVAGIIIGLSVPLLYLLGNKPFGISSSFRHLCAACLPSIAPYFRDYDWRNEIWNLFVIVGIVIGAALAAGVLGNDQPMQVADATRQQLSQLNVNDFNHLVAVDIFNFDEV